MYSWLPIPTSYYQIHESPGLKKRIQPTAPNPPLTLACATCTKERIRDGIAVAQVGVVSTLRAIIQISRGQRRESVLYKMVRSKGS